MPLKLAAYLDEAGDDAASACATLNSHKIPYVLLRNVSAGNICDAPDQVCQSIKEILNKSNISVIGVISDLGKVEPQQLMKIPAERINRVFNIATYYNAAFVRIHAGIKSRGKGDDVLRDWMQLITERALAANVTPVLEVTPESYIYQPAEVATLLTKYRRWKLLYDPAQIILRQNQDPFVRYWTLLKSFISLIDIRDFKIGHGFKPAGYGDAKLKLTLNDAAATDYKGWFCLEPSLGRRYASEVTKSGTFKLAVEALSALNV